VLSCRTKLEKLLCLKLKNMGEQHGDEHVGIPDHESVAGAAWTSSSVAG
jgi:hypothetical protein